MSRLDKSPIFFMVRTTKAKPRKTLHDPPDDITEMFAIEWRRAKRICKPRFAGIKKPKFYIDKGARSHTLRGWCRGGLSVEWQKVNGHFVKTRFVIALTVHGMASDPRKTIRHEIAHVITRSHNKDWKELNHWLQNAPL